MFSQDSLKTIILILVVIIVFSGVGFYTAFYIQEDRIAKIEGEAESDANRLSSEVVYLRNMFNDLLTQYEALEERNRELAGDLARLGAEYEELSGRYDQLEASHLGLVEDYRELNSTHLQEKEALLNKTRVPGGYVRVCFNNVSLEYREGSAFSLESSRGGVPTNITGLITGWPRDGRTAITLVWGSVEGAPDLNATLSAARVSIQGYVNETSPTHALLGDGYEALYANYTLRVGGEFRYMLVSSWYLADGGHQYLCVVRRGEDTVVGAFADLMARFRVG